MPFTADEVWEAWERYHPPKPEDYMKDFELALSELLDSYRKQIDQGEVVAAIELQLANAKEYWPDPAPVEPVADYVPGETLAVEDEEAAGDTETPEPPDDGDPEPPDDGDPEPPKAA